MNTVSGKDLIDFIMANKKDKVFLSCSPEQIAFKVLKAIEDGCLCYALNSTGKICGMLIAIRDDNRKELYISENLAITLSNLKNFAKRAKELYPDYKLIFDRHNVRKTNTTKMYQRLLQ